MDNKYGIDDDDTKKKYLVYYKRELNQNIIYNYMKNYDDDDV